MPATLLLRGYYILQTYWINFKPSGLWRGQGHGSAVSYSCRNRVSVTACRTYSLKVHTHTINCTRCLPGTGVPIQREIYKASSALSRRVLCHLLFICNGGQGAALRSGKVGNYLEVNCNLCPRRLVKYYYASNKVLC